MGLLITLLSLPLLTLPIALAAGIRHLRRYLHAEDSRLVHFWRDLRAGVLPGLVVGIVALMLSVLLLLDIDLARSGLLPGGMLISVIGWAGLAVVAVAVLSAAGRWSPETGWKRALASVPASVRDDPRGTLFLVAAAGLVVFLTWILAPLIIPALGCAALAVVAIPERPHRRR
jgi:hypothetical protein